MITTEEHEEHFVATFLVLYDNRRLLFKAPVFTSHLSSLMVVPLRQLLKSHSKFFFCSDLLWVQPQDTLGPQ